MDHGGGTFKMAGRKHGCRKECLGGCGHSFTRRRPGKMDERIYRRNGAGGWKPAAERSFEGFSFCPVKEPVVRGSTKLPAEINLCMSLKVSSLRNRFFIVVPLKLHAMATPKKLAAK